MPVCNTCEKLLPTAEVRRVRRGGEVVGWAHKSKLDCLVKCKHCEKVAPVVDFKRSPKGGFICRDKRGCAHDRRIRRSGGDPGPRGLQMLLRF